MIPSVIRWTGSKRRISTQIKNIFPTHINKYFEPFLGGGAMLYDMSEVESVGNDIYSPLIDLWRIIKTDPQSVINYYNHTHEMLSNEMDNIDISSRRRGDGLPITYYNIRRDFNNTKNPLALCFLLRTCVNGIVRFNSSGDFNTSFHLTRRGMKPATFANNVNKWSSRIQNVTFTNNDYLDVVSSAKSGDFIYLDPPYAGAKHLYSNAVKTNDLISALEMLNTHNVKWALSYDGSRGDKNFSYQFPSDLYKNLIKIPYGKSPMGTVLNKKNEMVTEYIYINY